LRNPGGNSAPAAARHGDLLRGFTVGEVRDVGFAYDPSTGALPTPATLEITEAARAVRALANDLDRHPEALIEGRRGVAQ